MDEPPEAGLQSAENDRDIWIRLACPAAAAGALGVELGGAASYFGRREEKPTLGDPRRPLTVEVYDDLIRLLYGTAVLALLTGLAGVLLWP